MKILIDCDGVLSDFTGSILEKLNSKLSTKYRREDITDFDIPKVFNIPKDVFWSLTKGEGFCLNMQPLTGAKDAILELRNLGEIKIATSPIDSKYWHRERILWLRKLGLKDDEIIFASDKTWLKADVLIEDKLSTVLSWAKAYPQSLSLICDATYNQFPPSLQVPANVHRVYDWNDIIKEVKTL